MTTLGVKKRLTHTYKNQTFLGEVIFNRITNKKEVKLLSKKYLDFFLHKHSSVGDRVSVNVKVKKPKRTEAQNNYYWFYLGIISMDLGHTPEEIHEWAKSKCLPNRIIKILGDPVRVKKSTTELTVIEFCDYILKIEEETGVPAPNTEDFGLKPLTPVKKEKVHG